MNKLQRLLLKTLIVLSDKEKRSKEINFEKGLNIIIGGNKTGKSSLIKSIFYTFGCGVKFEDEWKILIDRYLLFFQYGKENYCVLRQSNKFCIFHNEKLIFESDEFHEYSKTLMRIFGITMDCLTNQGKEISITPPLLFRFQYIDQDKGWDEIGVSFNNVKYIKDWKGHTNKYVVGFQGEEFYKLKKDKEIIKKQIESLNSKIHHYEEFILSLKRSFDVSLDIEEDGMNVLEFYEKSTFSNNNVTKELLDKLSEIEKERLIVEEVLSLLKNERYEKTLELEFIKQNIKSLEEDHEFAMQQEEKIKCHFCGNYHNNQIEDRIEIVKDIQTGNQMVSLLRKDIENLNFELDQRTKQKKELSIQDKSYRNKINKVKENTSIISTYKNEGKYEIIQGSLKEKKKVTLERDKEIINMALKDEELKELNSTKRRNAISKELKGFCSNVYEKLNIPQNYIKFSDFVQVLSKTGSENPRMIYGYHISLYLYNLKRGPSPFNILIIDTPNQQGQDKRNLNNIDSILEVLLNKKGQTIIGTERETGYESKSNVIELIDERRVLSNVNYNNHTELINKLLNSSTVTE